MAKVTIGGVEYLIKEMTFSGLERAWPYIEGAMNTNILMDPLGGPAAAIMVIAAGLVEDEGFDASNFGIKPEQQLNDDQVFEQVGRFLKKKLKATEINLVRECLEEIIKEAGLEPASGEDPAGPLLGQENPLPGTVADLLQNSLQQDAKEEAGTESAEGGGSDATTT